MMERLTERDEKGWAFIACRGCVKPHCTECKEFRKQAAALADYENLKRIREQWILKKETSELSRVDYSKEKFSELLIEVIEPEESELEELKDCVELFGTEIFNNLDYVNLSVKQLDKLNALRLLIAWPWEDV